jgi:hypothetical protein
MILKSIIKKLTYFEIFSICILSFIWVIKYFKIREGVFYNPDEYEWLYLLEKCKNRITLSTFDSHTTGPLAIFILHFIFEFFNDVSIENLHLIRLFIEIFCVVLIGISGLENSKKKLIVMILFVTFISLPLNDFLAYNTEYLILPVITFLSFQHRSYSLVSSLVQLTLIAMMPLIKLQAVPFSLFFFINLIKNQYVHGTLKSYLILILFSLSLFLTPIFLMESWQLHEIYFNYIEKNIWYVKEYGGLSLNSAFHSMILTFIYPLRKVSLILIICSVFIFTKMPIQKIRDFLVFPILLILVSLVCVITPRTNFTHYYILTIIPFTYFIYRCILEFNGGQKFFSLISIVLLIQTCISSIMADTIFWNNTATVLPNNNIKYTNSDINYKGLDSILIDLNKKMSKKVPILVTGWFEAQPIYYRYRHIVRYVYRSNSTVQMCMLKGSFLNYEIQQMNDDFETQGLPRVIVITNEYSILNKLKFLSSYQRIVDFRLKYVIYYNPSP